MERRPPVEHKSVTVGVEAVGVGLLALMGMPTATAALCLDGSR